MQVVIFNESNLDDCKILKTDSPEAIGKLCADIAQGRISDKDVSEEVFAKYLYEVSKAFYKAEHSRKTKEGIRKSKERKETLGTTICKDSFMRMVEEMSDYYSNLLSQRIKEGIRRSKERKAKELAEQAQDK